MYYIYIYRIHHVVHQAVPQKLLVTSRFCSGGGGPPEFPPAGAAGEILGAFLVGLFSSGQNR